MLTYSVWKDVETNDITEILFGTILALFTIPVDVLFLPIEAIAVIIYKLFN